MSVKITDICRVIDGENVADLGEKSFAKPDKSVPQLRRSVLGYHSSDPEKIEELRASYAAGPEATEEGKLNLERFCAKMVGLKLVMLGRNIKIEIQCSPEEVIGKLGGLYQSHENRGDLVAIHYTFNKEAVLVKSESLMTKLAFIQIAVQDSFGKRTRLFHWQVVAGCKEEQNFSTSDIVHYDELIQITAARIIRERDQIIGSTKEKLPTQQVLGLRVPL